MTNILAIDVIDRLPLEVQARLEADPFFSDIPVVVFDEGDIEKMVAVKEAAITGKGGKLGVAAIVLPIVADDDYPGVAFGPLTLRVIVHVVEQVEMNRDVDGTTKSARRVARKVRDILKPLRLVGLTTEFVTAKDCIKPVPLDAEYGKLLRVYAVEMFTCEADTEEISKVVMPSLTKIDDGGPRLQMSCETEGAAIWYSLDDSFPAPGRPQSKLYDAPIALTESVIVRLAAYRDGCIASDVNRATITVT